MRALSLIIFAILGTSVFAHEDLFIDLLNDRVYEDKINASIEALKETLNTGDPANGIPSFNPLQLDEVYANISYQDMIKTDLLITNLVGQGLTDFVATHLKFNFIGFKFDFSVFFNEINIKATYGGDAELFSFIPLYGSGIFDVTITELNVTGSFNLGTTGGNVSIDNLELILGVNDSGFTFTGLLNDAGASALISAALSDVIAYFINHRSEWVTATFSPIASDIANSLVEGMTVDDLLGMIGIGR